MGNKGKKESSSCYSSRAKRCPTRFAMATTLVCRSPRKKNPVLPDLFLSLPRRVQDTGLFSPTSLLEAHFSLWLVPRRDRKQQASHSSTTCQVSLPGWGRGGRARADVCPLRPLHSPTLRAYLPGIQGPGYREEHTLQSANRLLHTINLEN